MDLLEVLRGSSVEVVEVAGWRTRERPGTFTPVAQMDHHTGARSSNERPHPSLGVCVRGRADLPGPLCNGLIDYHGRLLLISDGRANDSGRGSGVVLGEVRDGVAPSGTARERHLADDTDGNRWFYDWELDYDGVDQRPTAAQVETMLRVNVGVLLAGGGIPIGHKEWTARKPDPRHVHMPDVRREVDRRTAALAAASDGTGPPVAPEPKPVSTTVAGARRVTIEGKPYMRQLVPVRLDAEGRGFTGPTEGLHIPMDKVCAVTSHGQAYPHLPPVGDGVYAGSDAYYHERGGELVVLVENGQPNTTAFPLVLTSD